MTFKTKMDRNAYHDQKMGMHRKSLIAYGAGLSVALGLDHEQSIKCSHELDDWPTHSKLSSRRASRWRSASAHFFRFVD